jgi:glyoxylase-like metal-dependent hydrolase (beta-lactamase superfamily II)
MRVAAILAGAAFLCLAACRADPGGGDNGAAKVDPDLLSLTRLDCGQAEFKNMDQFFSDTPGVYPPGSGKVTDSCYFIRHGKDMMLWDTGFPATATAEKPLEAYGMKAWITRSLVDQLGQLGLKPADITIVGISHNHGDHVGQASEFPSAKLVIGAKDFDPPKDEEDPFKPWRGEGKAVELLSADKDIFGDGKVIAIALPGHTPTHMGLLVNLASGPVLLSGDMYHSQIARDKRAMPGFNTSKTETLASMDKFEALAKKTGAKVIIQHEPNDISKLPAFPQEAK